MREHNRSLWRSYLAVAMSITALLISIASTVFLIRTSVKIARVRESINEVSEALQQTQKELEAEESYTQHDMDDTSELPLPPDLPPNFSEMSLEGQTHAMSRIIGLPLIPVPGEEGTAWTWNGRGDTAKVATCPYWVLCNVTRVSDSATLLFSGQGEVLMVYAGVFRVIRHIPETGGPCPPLW